LVSCSETRGEEEEEELSLKVYGKKGEREWCK
jgi:hypothetical protein